MNGGSGSDNCDFNLIFYFVLSSENCYVFILFFLFLILYLLLIFFQISEVDLDVL